jgi:hypothetical protein
VGESNKHLAQFVARIPVPPENKPKGAGLLWPAVGFTAAVAAGVAWAAFWIWVR